MINAVAAVLPGVGTIGLFQRLHLLLALRGVNTAFSWIIVVALFAIYVTVGMIAPIAALQGIGPRQWHAVSLVLFIGGVVTAVSLGGVLLVVAGVMLIRAGPDEALVLSQSPEAEVAEAQEDQRRPPRPANSCPVCGAALPRDENICPACKRRAGMRG